jgi:hypothetical protein
VVGRDVPALLLALIHPSAWNRNSANFAITEFSEVRTRYLRVSSFRCGVIRRESGPRRRRDHAAREDIREPGSVR